MTRSPRIRPAGALPNAYQEVLFWKMTESPRQVILAHIVTALSFCFFGLIFVIVVLTLGKQPLTGTFTLSLGETVTLMAGAMLTIILHTRIHGLAMQLDGARPSYAFFSKGMLLSVTTPGYAYQRDHYIAIALAPFIVISTLFVLGIWAFAGSIWVPLLAVCGVINASGSVGDLWTALIVLRYPPSVYIVDENDGIHVFRQSTVGVYAPQTR